MSMLIFSRRKAVQRRWDRFEVAKARAEEGREEDRFEERLGLGRSGWGTEWRTEIERIKTSFEREARRNEVRLRFWCARNALLIMTRTVAGEALD